MNAIARTTDKKPILSNAEYMEGVIRRMLRGRWPMLKSYSLRRSGACIYAAARWLRTRSDKPYCLIVWNVAELSIRCTDFRTLAEARNCMRTL